MRTNSFDTVGKPSLLGWDVNLAADSASSKPLSLGHVRDQFRSHELQPGGIRYSERVAANGIEDITHWRKQSSKGPL
jgi:hypothetical protein